LSIISAAGKPAGMTDAKPTREERLAARLRENLRLRKAQSRALRDAGPSDDAALPKPGGER
jgi:hypothetical protein